MSDDGLLSVVKRSKELPSGIKLRVSPASGHRNETELGRKLRDAHFLMEYVNKDLLREQKEHYSWDSQEAGAD